MPAEDPSSGETILVVDDDLHSRQVVEGHLEGEGYRVLQAENGKQALNLFARRSVDLVLLDVLMPGMGGFEVCRLLRAMDGGSEVPILFVTALGDLRTHEDALNSGADDFLSKPIQRVELLLRVKSLLRIKRLENDLARSNVLIRSQCEELKRAEGEKRRLTAMIVHDLRGPLTCILGNTEYVLDDASLAESAREALMDLRFTADTLHRMTNDLLDVAGSEDGALKPKLRSMDLPDFLSEVRAYLRGRERKSRHRILIDCQPAMGPVELDPDLVHRVVENLVDNSVKYAPPGTEIQLEASVTGGGKLLFKVRDRGPGVPAQHRTKIFDPYVQLDHAQREHLRTSRGLGLAFCKLVVEAHGGEIWVEENPPGGSAFCFWIPAAQEGQAASATLHQGCCAVGRPRGGTAEWEHLSLVKTA